MQTPRKARDASSLPPEDVAPSPSFLQRLKGSMLKPTPSATTAPAGTVSVPALEAEVKSATDKERLVGLLGAPCAGLIGILITHALVAHDPAATLTSGATNPLYVNVSYYYDLSAALLALSVLMLGFAWFRKRMLLGIVMAMYGLAVFNLHYWGFAVPYLLGSGWLLTRSYRLQRSLREATSPTSSTSEQRPVRASTSPKASASKRYTPRPAKARS